MGEEFLRGGGVLPHFPITSKSKFPTLSTLSQWNDMGEEFLRGAVLPHFPIIKSLKRAIIGICYYFPLHDFVLS